MKLYRNAIILVVLAALLTGGYFLAGKLKKDSPGAEEETTAATVKVTDYGYDDIVKVTVENPDGSSYTIEKKDKDWVMASEVNFKANQSKLGSIATNLSSIIADKTVETDAKDLSLYGLDKPVKFTFKLKDGKEGTLLIGSQTPTKSGYYAKLEDSGTVYVIGDYSSNALLVKLDDLRDTTLFTMKAEDIISLSMDRKGANVFKAQKSSDDKWNLTEPLQNAANTEATGKMLEAITSTTNMMNFIEASPADLVKYGLNKPDYALEFATSTEKYKLLFGYEKVKGKEIYAMLEGGSDVFTIDETAYTFLDKPLKEITDSFIYLPNIDQVNKIELVMDGKTTTFGLDIYKDAEGKSDSDKDRFTINGKDVSALKDKDDKQLFRSLYQSMAGVILSDIELGAVPAGNPVITITYYLKSAPGTMKVEYIPKNGDYYYAVRNGKYTGFVVDTKKDEMGINGLRTAYKTLMDAVNAQK